MRSLTNLLNIRNLLAAGTLAMGIGLGTSSASASDCYQPRSQYYYKTIIVYETVQKACVSWVKKYDHCDRPYMVKVVTYKTLQVPVENRIRVAF